MTASPLDRLALTSAALSNIDRSDLDTIEKLLAERQSALKDLEARRSGEEPSLSAQEHVYLQEAQSAGIRLRTKLLLTRAGLREQLRELFRSSQLLRALPLESKSPEQLDCRG